MAVNLYELSQANSLQNRSTMQCTSVQLWHTCSVQCNLSCIDSGLVHGTISMLQEGLSK